MRCVMHICFESVGVCFKSHISDELDVACDISTRFNTFLFIISTIS